jgi:hypothetical protein
MINYYRADADKSTFFVTFFTDLGKNLAYDIIPRTLLDADETDFVTFINQMFACREAGKIEAADLVTDKRLQGPLWFLRSAEYNCYVASFNQFVPALSTLVTSITDLV